MAEFTDREHYIPLRKSDLVKLLCKDPKLTPQRARAVPPVLPAGRGRSATSSTSRQLEAAQGRLRPLRPRLGDPAADSRWTRRAAAARWTRLFDDVRRADGAGQLQAADDARTSRRPSRAVPSDWGINMHVDFDVFERLEVFARGEGKHEADEGAPIFVLAEGAEEGRVLPAAGAAPEAAARQAACRRRQHRRRLLQGVQGHPQGSTWRWCCPGTAADAEVEKGKMGGSLLGTLGYGVFKVVQRPMLAAQIAVPSPWRALYATPARLWGPLLLLGGYGYKQYAGYQVTKQTYTKMLTREPVLPDARQQLRRADPACSTRRRSRSAGRRSWRTTTCGTAPPQGLDGGATRRLRRDVPGGQLGLKVDFEIGDALAKLERLRIVTKAGED